MPLALIGNTSHHLSAYYFITEDIVYTQIRYTGKLKIKLPFRPNQPVMMALELIDQGFQLLIWERRHHGPFGDSDKSGSSS